MLLMPQLLEDEEEQAQVKNIKTLFIKVFFLLAFFNIFHIISKTAD